ncbi:unnamed protein product [Rotaria magnacalcarata]|uniref:Uncharacterized protein n=2 Tax=Rotaria magnacalcarata TaxID=392030 RepID=A0A815Q4G1_9BILA|nr:unnamed protein product [Rotaria magnacalcarata]
MAEAAVPYFRECIVEEPSREKTSEAMLSDECDSCITTASNLVNYHKVKGTPDKVVFNDGTAAGVLSHLKGCTRTMHLHEADVTLKSLGLVLPSPIDITPTRVDPFRSTLMTLHEKPSSFTRILKNERIRVAGSKLNIFGASTGELLAAELARQAACMAADALFERFILWPIDGEPIPNEDCIKSIDVTQFPTLEQFAVLSGFFHDLYLDLEQEGKDILAEQAFSFRVADLTFTLEMLGSQEGVQDNVSARLNKSALVCYRIAGLCALVEAAFGIAAEYVEEYVTFGTGATDETFFHRASKVAERKYGQIIRKEQRLVIDTNICKRAHDVTVQNLAQYMALMKIQNEDKSNWLMQNARTIKGRMRYITSANNIEVVQHKNASAMFVNNESTVHLALTRKQKNMLTKVNHYKVSILLHPSLVFIKSSLYANSSLKKASSILEASFLKPLVNDGYLVAISNGLICRKSKVPVYIKMVPCADEESKEAFSVRLASFHDQRLNMNTYLATCKNIAFHSSGVISQEVIELLQLERYQSFKVDFSSLTRRISRDNGNDNLSHTCSISTQDNSPINSQSNMIASEDDYSNNPSLDGESIENPRSNISNLFDHLSEIDDASNASGTALVVINEEIVEEEPEINHDETIMVNQNSEIKRKTTNNEEIYEEELVESESFSETIAERLRSQHRKRSKPSGR